MSPADDRADKRGDKGDDGDEESGSESESVIVYERAVKESRVHAEASPEEQVGPRRIDPFGSSPLTSLSPSPIASPLCIQSSKPTTRQLPPASNEPKRKRKVKVKLEDGLEESSAREKKAKISYSGWYCYPTPPNIMSMLRFDHPPELMQAPMPVLPDYGQMVRPPVQRPIPASRQIKATSRAPKARTLARGRGRGTLAKEKNTEDGIVPLPTRLVVDGIPSSRFCAVLRLMASLPKPTPPARKPSIPVPEKRAPVWAESRQELCEALPYYRSFQSGLYMFGRVAFGYLLDAFPAPRDIWAHDGRVVISHGYLFILCSSANGRITLMATLPSRLRRSGGQCIRTLDINGKPGGATLQADQSRSDARVDTLLNARERRTPIILIAGAGYDFLPWTLDCAYAVLGWYWISLTWVEAEPAGRDIVPPPGRDYLHRYKIRFDWVEEQGVPWWHNSNSSVCAGTLSLDSASPSPPATIRSEVPSQPADSVTPTPTTRPRSTSPPDTIQQHEKVTLDEVSSPPRSAKRDIGTLLNHIGLPTPPPSSPERTASTSSSSNRDVQPSPSSLLSNGDANTVQSGSPTIPSFPGDRLLQSDPPLHTFSTVADPYPQATTCASCDQPIIQIYQEGPICLRPTCPAFFMLPTTYGLIPIPPGFRLSYTTSFLAPRTTPREVGIPYDVVPREPVRTVPEAEGETVGRTLWRGWVCRDCGRANCRYRWEVWECRNCGNTLSPLDPASSISAESLQAPSPPFMGDAIIHPSSCITSSTRLLDTPTAILITYQLGTAGQVHHLMPQDRTAADELLRSYQLEAARGGWFQRRPLKANTVKGTLLAQHFAVNSGASYKYIVDTMSYTFEESPWCVVQALGMITHFVDEALDHNARVAFNEILSVMYREGQKMSWHDDGEKDLGPTVASLSLGSTATMSFRLKTPRQDLNKPFYTGVRAEKHAPPTALSITLSHGDLMIMHGREIQRRYNHRVIPHGFRVAATARCIGEGDGS